MNIIHYLKRQLSKLINRPVHKGIGVTCDDSVLLPKEFDITDGNNEGAVPSIPNLLMPRIGDIYAYRDGDYVSSFYYTVIAIAPYGPGHGLDCHLVNKDTKDSPPLIVSLDRLNESFIKRE